MASGPVSVVCVFADGGHRNQDNKEEAEERFKEVAEAYDVLNDSDK